MLAEPQRNIIKSCVPALKTHGLTLTKNFYARMFQGNPELKHLFNMSHQATGVQQQALAMAVLGYAEHIDDTSTLAPVIQVITAKHASIGIRAEHYPIVGRHLLAAIADVLGEAATSEVLAAWAMAYAQLADALIAAEQALYAKAASVKGGWSGWRPFLVVRIERDSNEIASFYLQPTDGGPLPAFAPGQFVSIRMVDAAGMTHIRQYSLSDAPHHSHLRITVKREAAVEGAPGGIVSNKLHRDIGAGQLVELSFPQGYFLVDQEKNTPLVLLSGGVGITPMLSILGHIAQEQPQRLIHFAHAARNRKVHVMNDWLRDMAARYRQLDLEIYYEEVEQADVVGRHYDKQGRIDAGRLAVLDHLSNADYYICGPRGFMSAHIDSLKQAGIPEARIHAEFFGASLS